MRVLIAAAPLALLASCGGNAPQPSPEADANAAAAPEAAGSTTLPTSTDRPSPQPGPGGAFRWTRRFAASRALCTGGVWDIGRERIATAGETSCTVEAVAETPGRAVLGLSCLAEGMASEESWTLTRTGEGRMRVSRAAGAETVDVDLVRCG